MIKVLAFLEADLSKIENEINPYMKDYSIVYVWNTAARLIFILQEKAKPGRPPSKEEIPEES